MRKSVSSTRNWYFFQMSDSTYLPMQKIFKTNGEKRLSSANRRNRLCNNFSRTTIKKSQKWRANSKSWALKCPFTGQDLNKISKLLPNWRKRLISTMIYWTSWKKWKRRTLNSVKSWKSCPTIIKTRQQKISTASANFKPKIWKSPPSSRKWMKSSSNSPL